LKKNLKVRNVPREIPTNEVIRLKDNGQSNEQIIQVLQSEGFRPYQISEAINQAEIKRGVEAQMPLQTPEEKPSSKMQVSALDKEQEHTPVPPAPQAQQETQQPKIPSPAVPEVLPPPVPNRAPKTDSGSEVSAPTHIFEGGFEGGTTEPIIPSQSGGLETYEDVQAIVEEIIDEKWKEVMSSIGDITAWKTRMENDSEAMKQEIIRLSERFDKLQVAVIGKVEDYNKSIKDMGSELKAMEKVFEKILEPLTTNIKELNKITEKLKKKKS